MFHMSLKNTSGRVILMREHPKKMFGESKPSSKLTLVNGTTVVAALMILKTVNN